LQSSCIEAYGVQGFVEIVVLSGFYQMFAEINQGFAVALPAGVSDPFQFSPDCGSSN
jgi:4-carboxymuconolactone decarboxylase